MHEAITWKLYQSGNGNTVQAIATYKQSMPHHDETFMMMGLSMLDSVETGTLGISGVISGTIAVFPNPSEGDIHVSGITPGDRVSVYDQAGKMTEDFITDKNSIHFRLPQAGFYIIEVRGINHTFRAKALVR